MRRLILGATFALTGLALWAPAQQAGKADGSAAPIHGGNGVRLPAPPPTEKHPVTDDYHGVQVTDDYRWLEDKNSPATRAWIAAQNQYTDEYLKQVKDRSEIAAALTKLERVDTYGTPQKRGDHYFFTKRLASENQASIYMRSGWNGKDERLVDATKMSADQNTSVAMLDISKDGSLLAYGVRQGGADEMAVHVLRVERRKEMGDVLPSRRYFGVQIDPERKGLYYAVFIPQQGTLVYHHVFGEPVDKDQMVFGREYHGEKLGVMDLVGVHVSDNGHFLILTINRGVPPTRTDIVLLDLRKRNAQPEPLVWGINNRFTLLDSGQDDFYVQTDYGAPNGRILKAELDTEPSQWEAVVPESKNVIEETALTGRHLFVDRLVDVKSQTTIYSLDGKRAGQLTYPGIGHGTPVYGRPLDPEGFYSFQSFNLPPTIYRYTVPNGKTEIFAQPKVPFNSADYEVRQVFFASKDGTRVPMFIAGRKGLPLNGSTPLLMTGYGGFNLSMTPGWNPMYAWWLQQGGWFALPNMRGGGEYGESWHKAGMFEKKQNVFDDFFAAARYLIANKYTDSRHLAIWGRSNGGLLMGAAMTQHPELFGAIVCGYPLLDMLRYQYFEFGRLWTTEYGSAEDPAQFAYIRAYSPYQNVKPGTKYPPIMFFSGNNDTRVDPLHARKMTAEMQADTGGHRPILLHYTLKGGHSAGVSVTQQVQDETDILAFLWNEAGPQAAGGK
jgi:prolyl oligopeptidase